MSIVRCATTLVSLGLAVIACSKKDEAKKTEPAAVGSATAPVGSAAPTEPAGSAAAAGSAAEGSAAMAGSAAGSAAAPVAETMHLYMDVHELGAGKVKAADVVEAHKKDLAAQGKYHVDFKAYWVDEKAGKVYCLSEAPNPEAITSTHKEAHGLIPAKIMPVVAAAAAAAVPPVKGMKLYMDVHELGAGKVTAEAVADAHKKDLAVQGKYKVSFLDYWVDTESGTVMCLAQAPSAEAAIKTHKEAHGLVPKSMNEVHQGGL